jgi:hypothetical protein
VFELVNNGGGNYTQTTLLNFNLANGVNPVSGLIADAAGDLFGTTSAGGASSSIGTVFELVNHGGAYTPITLYSFPSPYLPPYGADGSEPYAGLIADAAGDLFGTTSAGGVSGHGTVFELVNNGGGNYTRTTLYSFTGGADGWQPLSGLIADAVGDLFGTTIYGGNGYGAVFELVNRGGGGYTPVTLYSFTGGADGANPRASLVADAAGDLFGTTSTDSAGGGGTVFEITNSGFVPFTPVVSPDFTHATFGQQDIVSAPGVLKNDQPATTGDTLTVSAVSVNGVSTAVSGSAGPTVTGHYGSLQIFADGHYDYTASGASALPRTGVSEDFFGYTAFDQGQYGSGSASSTLTVVVTAPGRNVIGTGQSGVTIQGPNGHKPVLDGSAGNDTLIAGTGATVMVGGPNDTLTAHKGYVDTCVFMGDFGNDTITNYNSVKDVIQL